MADHVITATPLWDQLVLPLTKCMEMTTVVDTQRVLHRFEIIADTKSSVTVCRQYVKILRTRQKHGKLTCI